MQTIGFIDYFLDEWHANNYPEWIKQASGGELQVAYAYGKIDSPRPGGLTTDDWCAKYGITRCATIEEVVEKSDCLLVLSPDNCEMHEELCQIPLRSGKRTYVDKTFAPDLTLTRAMLAVILYARAGEPAVTAENKFSDVPTGQWYTNAVIWAAENGIVAGCGDGTFRPDAAVTRAQAAVMLCGFAAFSGDDVTARADLSAFGDAADVPSWAQAELQWTVARQLIVGRDGKLLAPNDAVTRAEMASILSGYAAA